MKNSIYLKDKIYKIECLYLINKKCIKNQQKQQKLKFLNPIAPHIQRKKTQTLMPKVANKNSKKTKTANQRKILRKVAVKINQLLNLKKLKVNKKAKRSCRI